MKVMRFLALAATLSMIFPLAAPASSNASKEQKKRVAVEDQVKLAGKTLMPGSYEVEWQGNGPAVNVSFLKSGKTVLTAPATVAQLQEKAPYDAVVESTNKDGNKTISEIEWHNQREALRFGAPAHSAHHAHKGAS